MSGAHARQRNPIFNDFLEIDCVESLLGNPLIAIKNSKRLFLPWGRKRR